jgi:tRNA pseudouridine55 synthase
VIDGLVIVDKPAGMTSHDVVARCRKRFGQKKVGHAGTLDPDATGVLVVGLGRATRLLQFQSGLPKSYTAEVVLGVATTTLDAAGQITRRWDQRHVTLAEAQRAARQLTGTIQQTPPMVSAIKVGGRRLHQLAREGVEVERSPRKVTVSKFDVEPAPPDSLPIELDGAGPVFVIAVDCSSGTYVRTLAADLGTALGGGAHLRRLRRTAVGPWIEDRAIPLDSISPDHVIPPAAALPWLGRVEVDQVRAAEVANGRVLDRDVMAPYGATGDGPWTVIGPGGDLLAVYERAPTPGRLKPALVLASAGG